MEYCHTESFLQNPAAQRLATFVQAKRKQWAAQGEMTDVPAFERFEQELHTLVMALESELVGEELSRYDVTVQEIEVAGKAYRRGVRLPESYLTAAGCVTVDMQPSRSSLDRLPKVLLPHWEEQRVTWEAQLRATETVPAAAQVLALSVDGVMAPIRGADKREQATLPGKHASGPTGYKEVGCGTVTLYGQAAERLQTVRYARMPEHKKATLQQQLTTEVATVLALKPELQRVYLADGAKDNWRLMREIEDQLPAPAQAPIEIVDDYHACEHLKNGCDAAWGESTQQSMVYFARLRTWLKERTDGVERIIRTLRFQCSLATGRKCKRLEAELTYFRNQQARMHYPDYIRRNLPIASGVMEASCKTLVTQRLKRSGMAWTNAGGQAILTLRSLIQSNRWPAAWGLLSADFRKTVTVLNQPTLTTSAPSQIQPHTLPAATRPVGPFQDGTFAANVNNYIVRKGSAQPGGAFASIAQLQAA